MCSPGTIADECSSCTRSARSLRGVERVHRTRDGREAVPRLDHVDHARGERGTVREVGGKTAAGHSPEGVSRPRENDDTEHERETHQRATTGAASCERGPPGVAPDSDQCETLVAW